MEIFYLEKMYLEKITKNYFSWDKSIKEEPKISRIIQTVHYSVIS